MAYYAPYILQALIAATIVLGCIKVSTQKRG